MEQAAQLGILPQSLQSDYQTAITRGEFCRLLSGYLAARSGVSAAEFCRNRGIDPASASFSDTADADIRLIAATGVVTGYRHLPSRRSHRPAGCGDHAQASGGTV